MNIGLLPDGTPLSLFDDERRRHIYISGKTGTGKTTFGARLVKKLMDYEYTVVCVDITGDYRSTLESLDPVLLDLDEDQQSELSDKLQDVETGEYGAKAEKKALFAFAEEVGDSIKEEVDEFIESESNLGLIQLPGSGNQKMRPVTGPATVYR